MAELFQPVRPVPPIVPGVRVQPAVEVQTALFRYPDSGGGVEDLSLTIAPGELVVAVGPSGCGKSTLLRLVAGFLRPQKGWVRIGGVDQSGVPARERDCGVVFQSYALFPTMRVWENVAYPLRVRRVAAAERRDRAHAMLETMGLQAHADRMPAQLSGGQQQRVALARALVFGPRALLLDEPLSALDAAVRLQMRDEIRRIQRDQRIATLLITHDQDEALSIADRVAVMRAGRIEQADSPWQLYHRPASRYVAGFVGEGVLLPLHRDGSGWACALGPLAATDTAAIRGDGAVVLVRPDDLLPQPQSPLRARVDSVEFRGAEELLSLVLADGSRVFALWPSHERARAGTEVGLHWQPPHVVTFDA